MEMLFKMLAFIVILCVLLLVAGFLGACIECFLNRDNIKRLL